jgi:hypothetical protein
MSTSFNFELGSFSTIGQSGAFTQAEPSPRLPPSVTISNTIKEQGESHYMLSGKSSTVNNSGRSSARGNTLQVNASIK